jgi:predicted DNA-binding transcriptional regulator YafY
MSSSHCLVVEMPLTLTSEEMVQIYLVLKAVQEGQLVYPDEEWELDHFDERLIDRAKVERISRKLRKMLPEEDVENVDKKVLLRKSSVGSEVNESVYSRLEKAFSRKRRVEIEYFSVEQARAVKRRIDIYYKSRRYVIAFCHLRGAIRKFRISRIVRAKSTEEVYSIPDDFDKREYL